MSGCRTCSFTKFLHNFIIHTFYDSRHSFCYFDYVIIIIIKTEYILSPRLFTDFMNKCKPCIFNFFLKYVDCFDFKISSTTIIVERNPILYPLVFIFYAADTYIFTHYAMQTAEKLSYRTYKAAYIFKWQSVKIKFIPPQTESCYGRNEKITIWHQSGLCCDTNIYQHTPYLSTKSAERGDHGSSPIARKICPPFVNIP